MIRTTWILLLAAMAARAECIVVAGPRVFASDLQRSGVGSTLAPDAFIAFAPEPGMERQLSALDLQRLNIAADRVCFRRLARPLTAEQVEAALAAALSGRAVRIELLDFSRAPLAEGELKFSLAGLARPRQAESSAAVLWRGQLVFDGNRTMPVWASVRLSEVRKWVESTATLHPGVAVEAEQVTVREEERFPLGPAPIADPAAFVGRVPRRTIAAGQQLRPELFDDAPLVARGETVAVEVLSGAVRLRLEGKAEAAARSGEPVLVLDPSSGKRLKARVAGKGKVTIDANVRMSGSAAHAGSDSGAGDLP